MTASSAELYDPAPGTFSATGSMTVGGLGQTATLLASGRILIAGGTTTTRISTNSIHPSMTGSAELYDPASGTFSPTGSMTIVQDGDTATLLADGRVLFAAGVDQSGAAAASAELYDPATGKFGGTGSMTSVVPVGGAAAALLSDGRVLIVGGAVPF